MVNKIRKSLFSFVFILLIVLNITNASSFLVNINIKESFNINEKISFSYEIVSPSDEYINYVAYVTCPNAPIPLLELREIELKQSMPLKETYRGITITNDIESQTCIAYVKILSPVEQEISKNFSIVTDPSFSFNIFLSKKVFIKDEDIRIDYRSGVVDPSVKAVLKYPDGKSTEIKLPSSIEASQIGTYELEVTATKEGYKTQSVKEQFGVIKKPAEIREVEKPNLEEFKYDKKVPEKLWEGKIDGLLKSKIIFWAVIILLVIIILIIIYFLLKGRKRI